MDHAADLTLDNLPVMNIINGAATITIVKEEAAVTPEQTPDAPTVDGTPEQGNQTIVWVLIGSAAALLVAGAVAFVIIISKKKRSSAKTEDSEE